MGNWDHQTIGVVYQALIEKKQEMQKYVREMQPLPVVEGYKADIERLDKVCKELEERLKG